LLKSELIKDIINPKKLITTKKNLIIVKYIIFLSKISLSLKFLTEKKIIKTEKRNPKPNE
jgi:hypothetical protein